MAGAIGEATATATAGDSARAGRGASSSATAGVFEAGAGTALCPGATGAGTTDDSLWLPDHHVSTAASKRAMAAIGRSEREWRMGQRGRSIRAPIIIGANDFGKVGSLSLLKGGVSRRRAPNDQARRLTRPPSTSLKGSSSCAPKP